MHEAADQVQRKVQRMADAEHEHEEDRAAHGHAVGVAERAELVEYARNNAAGEHQRHQTRVREQIAQIPGRAVVHRAENAGDLSEALAGDELSEHEHADADEENDLRSAGHHDENARDHHPPAQIVEQSVRPLAVLELEIDADARAERQMDRAEADRRDEDIQRVVALEQVERQIDRDAADMDRAEVRYDRPVPAEPTADDGDNVAEEAAGQEAYDECGNAAFDQQPRGVFHASLRLCLPEEEQSRDQQYQAVRHIREHDAEEQREKRHDKGVGVKSVVRRERIHLRDDVVRTGQRVIAQLDGDLLRVLRIGLLRFPGAAVF